MSNNKSANVVWHHGDVSRDDRRAVTGQSGCTVWLTGLPSSGKSTLAFAVEKLFTDRGQVAYVLDGDNVRHGLCGNLGFSADDRAENIRRIGEVARLFADAGVIVLCSFVSPYRADRAGVRTMHDAIDLSFFEIYINTPVDICEQRDPKGLYKKARAGDIKGFTGVDDPYEAPEAPDLEVDAANQSVAANAERVVRLLSERGIIAAS